MISRRRFLAVSAAAMATPATAAARTPSRVTWSGVALGADARITVEGEKGAAEDALLAARQTLDEAASLFSLYDPDSVLSRLNREGLLSSVPEDFAHLLALSAEVNTITEGCFDPTVQPLWRALSAGEDTAAARRLVGWEQVRVVGRHVALGAGQALTLNGIAQGAATDMVAKTLANRGFGQALVNVGEYRCLGGPWRLGVEDPIHGLVAARTLSGGAIATSSPGALMLNGGGSHIVDPRVSGPAVAEWSTVSVEADTAALADGVSTALVHLPLRVARHLCLTQPSIHRITLVSPAGEVHSV